MDLAAAETQEHDVSGEFLTIGTERYYVIRNMDRMRPFFMSLISSVDHWLFISSTGGLTAGRISPDFALFPYVTVDKIHDSHRHTGCRTIIRVRTTDGIRLWEPFDSEQPERHVMQRNLYKNVLGNKLCFEEVDHSLQLAFRYTWSTSDQFGFVRDCEIENLGDDDRDIDILDGFMNVLPAGIPPQTQARASNLVNAYKWTELDDESGLALYALYSGISDRAEPCESLRANVVYALGLDHPATLLSDLQLETFRNCGKVVTEPGKRGIRGAYLVSTSFRVDANGSQTWSLVADVEKTQSEIVALQRRLRNPVQIEKDVSHSVASASDELERIMGATDAFQSVAEEIVSVHHYANVLFNVLRGGVFDEQYTVTASDVSATIRHFNRPVWQRHRAFLDGLPSRLPHDELLELVHAVGDPQMDRLCLEYLPITFGRRHGDPSRPWNRFSIRPKDSAGNRLLSYEGNWRDIFQNWEALALSYPGFIECIIAKFVNASTADGYNPYRINKEGIDWEVEDKDDPWSYIGYWGDHQIIYLLKLLELSRRFHPERLGELLYRPVFSYANVPYRIRPFEALLQDPKSTVDYDHELAARIDRDVAEFGADAKLIRDGSGDVYQVSLLEKLLVTLLAKISNTVIDGGVWLNTQRPEWNDANNALVGQGLSMVTMYYIRRFIRFLLDFLEGEERDVVLSLDVAKWLADTSSCVDSAYSLVKRQSISGENRLASLRALGDAASEYRNRVYSSPFATGKTEVSVRSIADLLEDTLALVDHSIQSNKRDDGLYHAYNLLNADGDQLNIGRLYPMLEGQVAVLSSGALDAREAVTVVDALFESDIYHPDQNSFMLYPDRHLPGFLKKNRVAASDVGALQLLQDMLDKGDDRVIERDPDGTCRFNADLVNADALNARLDELAGEYGQTIEQSRPALQVLYEKVFDHRSFTGRSGAMFGYEGLGCIYWHMVSKLLLAIQEVYFSAAEAGEDAAGQLGMQYYRVRSGLGFNKTPPEYGAFPADPYSHTPGHSGARQPGMTGQVKEEILTRFGELGLVVKHGIVRFRPCLLRELEFSAKNHEFRYLDTGNVWQSTKLPARSLAYSWCQVPIVYRLADDEDPGIELTDSDGTVRHINGLELSPTDSSGLFGRDGRIRKVDVHFPKTALFSGYQLRDQ